MEELITITDVKQIIYSCPGKGSGEYEIGCTIEQMDSIFKSMKAEAEKCGFDVLETNNYMLDRSYSAYSISSCGPKKIKFVEQETFSVKELS